MKDKRFKSSILYTGGTALILFFIFLTGQYFNLADTVAGLKVFFIKTPIVLMGVTIAYFLSFLFRAMAWRIYLGYSVRLASCLQAILLSLAINHLSPLKIGDAFRAGLLCQKEKHIKPDISAHSVVVLRLLDLIILIFITAIGLITLRERLIPAFHPWIIPAAMMLILVLGIAVFRYFPSFLKAHLQILKQAFSTSRALPIFILVLASWMLEGAVIWGVAGAFGNPLGFIEAIWVNSVTVGGQVFQVTPGGIATYESVMSIALMILHIPAGDGYLIALVSHGYKFIFSYAAGIGLLMLIPFTQLSDLRKMSRTGGNPK